MILNKLSKLSEICNIPYSVYFLSCNLEHVLHNVQNVLPEEKMKYATSFSDKYVDNIDDFIKFMNSNEIAVNGNYDETWDFIKQNNNSLNRHCNFHLFINKLLKGE